MRAFEHEVSARVDERLFRAGVGAPKDEHDVLPPLADDADDVVGKPRPAAVFVRIGLVRAHGQGRVQQQHALFGPLGKIARAWQGAAQLVVQFFEDIYERRGHGHALLHRKAQPVRLPLVVVGVLPQDHRLHLRERGQLEAVVDVVHVGVDDVVRILALQKFADLFIIFVLEEGRERLVPAAAQRDHAPASAASPASKAISSSLCPCSRAR